MTGAHKEPKDIWSGTLFVIVGASAVAITLLDGYEVGTARKMGPGFFPLWIGAILCTLGAALAIRGVFQRGAPVGKLAWGPMLLVTIGTVAFGATVNWAGLFPATVLLVLVTAYASRSFRIGPGILLAIGLAVFSVVVFVLLLGVSLPIMPHVLGR